MPITQEVFFKIYSEANQVVYLSLSVYLSSFKALALVVFLDILLTRLHPYFINGHNSGKGHNPVKKKNVPAMFS